VAVTLQAADKGDTTTLDETLCEAVRLASILGPSVAINFGPPVAVR
jgi:hypothetical protein